MRIILVAISAMALGIFAVACGSSDLEVQTDNTSASEPTAVIATPTALPLEPTVQATEPVATVTTAPAIVPTAPAPTATTEPSPTSEPATSDVPERDLEIVTLLPPDAIPSIDHPIFFETLEKADAVYSDSELVLGIEIDGDARAYSVPLLSSHEIVNDVVAGNPIAVSW